MGFFGIDEGPSKGENKAANNLTAATGFATGLGESDLTTSSNWMQDVLSGDPTKISQALAAPISAETQQANQAKKTSAEFGTRSGGTASANANIDTNTRADIAKLISNVQSGAAAGLSTIGGHLLDSGMSGDEAGFAQQTQMQQQRAQKINDIINSIASIGTSVLGSI